MLDYYYSYFTQVRVDADGNARALHVINIVIIITKTEVINKNKQTVNKISCEANPKAQL